MVNNNAPNPNLRDARALLKQVAEDPDLEQIIVFARSKNGQLGISYSDAPTPIIWMLAEWGHRGLWDTLMQTPMKAVPQTPPFPPVPHKPLDG